MCSGMPRKGVAGMKKGDVLIGTDIMESIILRRNCRAGQFFAVCGAVFDFCLFWEKQQHAAVLLGGG